MKFNINLNQLGHSVLANGITLLLIGVTSYTASTLFNYRPHFCQIKNDTPTPINLEENTLNNN